MGDKMSLCWQLTLIGMLIAVSHSEKSTELIRLLKTFKEIMTIKPLNDRVLIEPAKAEEVVGGIIIPDSAKEKPLKGKVRAAGNGTKDEEMIVKPGDIVLYGKYAGNEIEIDGEKLLMMRQNDILAIVMD